MIILFLLLIKGKICGIYKNKCIRRAFFVTSQEALLWRLLLIKGLSRHLLIESVSELQSHVFTIATVYLKDWKTFVICFVFIKTILASWNEKVRLLVCYNEISYFNIDEHKVEYVYCKIVKGCLVWDASLSYVLFFLPLTLRKSA